MKADNKTKTLQIDSNADIIFKQGDYVHTYVVLDTSGYTNGSILYLLDSDMNQLYSPYDVNANQIKTECTIVVGETDALQLPANYNGNEYTDFEEGTYNWKLKYNGNQTFAEQIIPIIIKIQDFDLEKNLTSEIYPNENIQIQLKTWLNTNPSVNNFDMDRLTTNASYDSSTGIITYPNSDINDLTIGEHTQVINQTKNYHLNYTIKNPIYFYSNRESYNITSYSDSVGIGAHIKGDCSLNLSNTYTNTIIFINNTRYVATNRINLYNNKFDYILKKFCPGSYSVLVTTILSDGQTYSDSGNFVVSTINCTLTLSRDENNIVATYMHNNETPIPNASIQILEDGIVVDTLITDNNGQCSITGQYNSTYKAQAIDYDNSILLESSTLTMELEFITINITNMPPEYEWFNIGFNGAPEDIVIRNFSSGYASYIINPTNIDRLTLENNILSINIDKYLFKKYVITYNRRNVSITTTWPQKYLYNLEDNDNDDIITVAFEDLPNQPNEG